MKYLTLLFLALTPLYVQAATVTGTVEDSFGAVIPKAYVVIHWDSVGLDKVKENRGTNETKFVTSDENGAFSLDLQPGVYDIFVSAAGFAPHCEKVIVKSKKGLHYQVQLTVTRMEKVIVD